MFRQVFVTIGRSLYDLWDNLLVLVVANLAWAISLVPAMLVGFLPLAAPLNVVAIFVVLGLTLGPTTIGLYYLTSEITREERVELGQFFQGVRRYWRRGLLLMVVNVIFGIVAYFNFLFYSSQFAGSPMAILSILWVYLAVTWLILQVYIWPLAVRTVEEFRLGTTFRNAFLATFKYPLFSLMLGLLLLAIGYVSIFFVAFIPTIFIGAVFHALVSNRALTVILERERERAEITKNDEAINPPHETEDNSHQTNFSK